MSGMNGPGEDAEVSTKNMGRDRTRDRRRESAFARSRVECDGSMVDFAVYVKPFRRCEMINVILSAASTAGSNQATHA
jgi:hypothetical protein